MAAKKRKRLVGIRSFKDIRRDGYVYVNKTLQQNDNKDYAKK